MSMIVTPSEMSTMMAQMRDGKLRFVRSKSIILTADFDLTLVAKTDPKNTDHASFLPHHYKNLCWISKNIARVVIVTARGEESLLYYFGEHVPQFGRMENVTVATNSGHIWHKLDQHRLRDAQGRPIHKSIAIPGMSAAMADVVVWHIQNALLDELQKGFPDATIDHREKCGAAIFQFKGGDADDSRFAAFQRAADGLLAQLPEEIRNNIEFARKSWLTIDEETVEKIMQGYIDITPKGMSKGHTAPILFKHYSEGVDDPFLIVCGDSGADYKMMVALAREVPPERRLFIAVGPGLNKEDDAFAEKHGRGLLDIVFQGVGNSEIERTVSAVGMLHDALHGFVDIALNNDYDYDMQNKRNTALDRRARPLTGGPTQG